MSEAMLEHVNVTVSDARQTAAKLIEMFGWHTRWEGPSIDGGGYTVHVGTGSSYLAVYSIDAPVEVDVPRYAQKASMNHIGVVVDDLPAAEARVRAAGYKPHAHFDYEPGERFYFSDEDGLEFEVVSYRS